MISKKTKKAVDVCVYLCEKRAKGYVTATEMAPDLGLSVSHLENILKSLRDHGIVTSTRGPGGGYAISETGWSQSVWDVVVIFEDTLGQANDLNPNDSIASYERGLEQTMQQALSGLSLSAVNPAHGGVALTPTPRVGRFKFRPLPPPALPRAANSVFEWHMMAPSRNWSSAR
jgi:Rrf2 family protein